MVLQRFLLQALHLLINNMQGITLRRMGHNAEKKLHSKHVGNALKGSSICFKQLSWLTEGRHTNET